MLRVSVSQYTTRGEPLEMLCEFDPLGDKLYYSVSWYKDHDEFYRYVPRGTQPQHTYKIDGIKVDVSMRILLFMKHTFYYRLLYCLNKSLYDVLCKV